MGRCIGAGRPVVARHEARSSEEAMSVVRFVLVAIVFIAILFVSLDNAETVTLKFFRLAEWQAPLVLVVFCAFALGAALGLAAGALRTARVRRELNRVRREQRKAAQAADGVDSTTHAPIPPFDAV
jgi:uncharacterized integral membrane protein